MRRTDREQSRDFALSVIDRCEYAVAAFASPGAPYCVPLSIVRVEDVLYFHCALEGTKTDLLRADPRVTLSFVGANRAAETEFSTYYESAVVTGTAYEVTSPAEKAAALRALCQKLTPGFMDHFPSELARSAAVTAVWGVRMEQVTGKAKFPPKAFDQNK